jgi:hypothetical protein
MSYKPTLTQIISYKLTLTKILSYKPTLTQILSYKLTYQAKCSHIAIVDVSFILSAIPVVMADCAYFC